MDPVSLIFGGFQRIFDIFRSKGDQIALAIEIRTAADDIADGRILFDFGDADLADGHQIAIVHFTLNSHDLALNGLLVTVLLLTYHNDARVEEHECCKDDMDI